MLEYTQGGSGTRFMLLVLHDDAKREYPYGPARGLPGVKLGAFTPEGEAKRVAVNDWLRRSADFDAVIDFDAALRDPEHPTRMLPVWDNGDHLHPSDAGYNRMGDVIDLALFD